MHINNLSSKKIYISILIITLSWNLVILISPLLLSLGGFYARIGNFIYFFFSVTCHQFDERSFHLLGFKFAVCSRCISVYLAFLLSVILYPLFYKLENKKLPSLLFLIIPVMLLILDVFSEILGIFRNSFLTRSITGALIGFVLPFYLIPGFINFFNELYLYFIKNYGRKK